MESNKRSFLKKIGLGALSASSFSTITTAQSDIEEPVETLALEVAENSKKNLVAFTTTKDNVLCLHIAIGTDSKNKPADKIVRITEPSNGSVMNIKWKSPKHIRYWQNGAIHELTVTSSGTVANSKTLEQKRFPSGVISDSSNSEPLTSSSTPKVEPDRVVRPGWMDDPKYDHEGIKLCKNSDWGDVCLSTTKFSPKFYTVCTGKEVPLVGASFNGLAVTVPSGTFSISVGAWAGYNPQTDCVYFGSSALDICEKRCFNDVPPSQAQLEQWVLDLIVNALEDTVTDVPNYVETALEIIIAAAATAIVMFILSIVNLVTFGSATA